MISRRSFLRAVATSVAGLVATQHPDLEALAGENLAEMITRHEGKRNLAYPDSRNIKTIGIGFNLERADARQKIQDLGLSYDAVLTRKQSLTDEQINKLFSEDLDTATKDAKKYLGKTFEILPVDAQNIITDMSFNLGYSKLSEFRQLKYALDKQDYISASEAMKNSRWYSQVGNRSRELVGKMRKLGEK